MSRLDFNKPGDFASATLTSIGSIIAQFGAGRDPTKWDLVEASYKGVKFHVFQSTSEYQAGLSEISDKGGRRKVPLKFPYRDGQTTDDLGREPETFSVDILLHGNRYLTGLTQLLQKFNETTPGEFIHPVRGNLTCVAAEWTIIHKSDTRKAAQIQVTFMEHNFTVLVKEETADKSVKGAIASALEAFQKINNVLLQVTGAIKFAQSVINSIKTAIQEFQYDYAQLLAAMNNNFNAGSLGDFPSLLPVNQGGNLGPDGEFVSDNFAPAATQLSSVTVQALNAAELQKKLNANRLLLQSVIEEMSSAGNGQGSLDFYNEILELKRTAQLAQAVYDRGVAASQSKIINYTVPRLMSIRELAFENGVPLERVVDIDVLNKELSSVNFIEKGTIVRVPLS